MPERKESAFEDALAIKRAARTDWPTTTSLRIGDKVKSKAGALGTVTEIGEENCMATIYVWRGDEYGLWRYHPSELEKIA